MSSHQPHVPPPPPRPPRVVTCPKCKRGVRVEASYEYGGLLHDDSYCGFCGKNWPRPRLVKAPR